MSYPVQTDSKTRLQARLKALAEEISTELAQLESEQSKELLSDFEIGRASCRERV